MASHVMVRWRVVVSTNQGREEVILSARKLVEAVIEAIYLAAVPDDVRVLKVDAHVAKEMKTKRERRPRAISNLLYASRSA